LVNGNFFSHKIKQFKNEILLHYLTRVEKRMLKHLHGRSLSKNHCYNVVLLVFIFLFKEVYSTCSYFHEGGLTNLVESQSLRIMRPRSFINLKTRD